MINLTSVSLFLQEELDIRPKVSSLLSRLVNYTNITQGAKEHEEEESAEASRRKTPKVSSQGRAREHFVSLFLRTLSLLRFSNTIVNLWLSPCLAIQILVLY